MFQAESAVSERISCCCKQSNAYDCWRERYRELYWRDAQEIENEGGPCECLCHDRPDEEEL